MTLPTVSRHMMSMSRSQQQRQLLVAIHQLHLLDNADLYSFTGFIAKMWN
jgi:hypothetical protein